MFLSIDYGLSHIGLAISEGYLARPLKTLHVKNINQALNLISAIVTDQNINEIVVGISEGKSRQRSEIFGKKLEEVLRLKVNFVDETLSSVEATTKRADKTKEHAKAAAIILQRYLDTNYRQSR